MIHKNPMTRFALSVLLVQVFVICFPAKAFAAQELTSVVTEVNEEGMPRGDWLWEKKAMPLSEENMTRQAMWFMKPTMVETINLQLMLTWDITRNRWIMIQTRG